MGQFNHYTVTIGLKWLNCSSYKCRSFIARKKTFLTVYFRKLIPNFCRIDKIRVQYWNNEIKSTCSFRVVMH